MEMVDGIRMRTFITKACSKCGKTKPLGEFCRAKRYAGGYHSRCKVCTREYKHKWYRENRDRVIKYGCEYYKKNREKIRKYYKKWNRENPEKIREYSRRWYQENPEYKCQWNKENPEYIRKWRKTHSEKMKTYWHNRRVRKLDAEGSFTAKEWMALCERYGNKCLRCHRTDKPLAADHVIPIGPPHRGTNYIWNIQPLCQSCNSKKYQRTDDYRFDHRFEATVVNLIA